MQARQRTALLLAVLVGLVAVQAAVAAVGTTGLATATVGNETVTEPTDAVDGTNTTHPTTDIEGTPPTATVPGTPTSVETSTGAGSGTERGTATATEATETTKTATPTSTPVATQTATATTTGDATGASDTVTNTTNETTGSTVPSEDDATGANESTDTSDGQANQNRSATATPTESTGDTSGSNEASDGQGSTSDVGNASDDTAGGADERVNDSRPVTESDVNETADTSERTVAAGVNSTQRTVEESNETVQTHSDRRSSVVNETRGTAEETAAGVVERVNESVQDEVDGTTSNATGRVVDTVGESAGPIDDVVGTADGTVDDSTTAVSDTVVDTTRTLGDVAGDTAASVGALTSGATESLDDSTTVAGVVDTLPTKGTADEIVRTVDDGAAAVLGRTETLLSRSSPGAANVGPAVTDRLSRDAVGPASLARSPRAADRLELDPPRDRGERHRSSVAPRPRPDRSPALGDERLARKNGAAGAGMPARMPPAAGVLFGTVAIVAAVARTGGSVAGWFSLAPGGTLRLQARLVAGWLRGWLGRVPRVLPIPGYSRYDDSDPLENDRRARLYEAVTESPGVDLASLVERTGVSRSTARYHLRVLEHEGQVTARTVRGRRRLYPANVDDVELQAAVRDESTQAVLEAVARREPASGTTLAEALDRDPSTVTHHLTRLAEAGLVDRERDGRAVVNRLTPAARRELRPAAAASAGTRRAVESDD